MVTSEWHRFALCSGDPLQLPPLIAQPPHVQQQGSGGRPHGLLRPLFVRLAAMGHRVHLLRRQYRHELHSVYDQQALPNVTCKFRVVAFYAMLGILRAAVHVGLSVKR